MADHSSWGGAASKIGEQNRRAKSARRIDAQNRRGESTRKIGEENRCLIEIVGGRVHLGEDRKTAGRMPALPGRSEMGKLGGYTPLCFSKSGEVLYYLVVTDILISGVNKACDFSELQRSVGQRWK